MAKQGENIYPFHNILSLQYDSPWSVESLLNLTFSDTRVYLVLPRDFREQCFMEKQDRVGVLALANCEEALSCFRPWVPCI